MLKSEYGVFTAFSAIALSYEIKAMKPDPKIYLTAAKLAGVKPGEIFFCDDVMGHVVGRVRPALMPCNTRAHRNWWPTCAAEACGSIIKTIRRTHRSHQGVGSLFRPKSNFNR